MKTMNWKFPILDWHLNELPDENEPGSFGFVRKYDVHTGVDLYTQGENLIKAVESGFVVNIEDFTGPKANSPWWLYTKSILVSGESGVVCYGEVNPIGVSIGDMILKDQIIAHIVPVLKTNPNPNIKNHSNHMLHFELYKHGIKQSVVWNLNKEKPECLLNPTNFLKKALENECTTL